MKMICLSILILSLTITLGSPQINFGSSSVNKSPKFESIKVTDGQTNKCGCIQKEECTDSFGYEQCNNPPNFDGTGLIDDRIVNKPEHPSGILCLPNSVYCCPKYSYICGVQKIIPVTGYTSEYGQADFGEYPWLAVILSQSDEYIGVGALLDNYHVLTVAHRVVHYKPKTGEMKVRLGEWNAQDTNEPYKHIEKKVERIDIHPDFNSGNLQNDVAIITLKHTVEIENYPHINPVCLPNKPGSNFVGERCWVAGFGKNAFKDGDNPVYLKEVDLPIVDSNECQNLLRGTRLGKYFLLNRESFLCAGGEAGKDACTADGGAPLVCKNYNGQFQVVGLVAWGIDCAQYGVPGVYVNVQNFVDWIKAKLN